MSRIKIKNFGPIKEISAATDGWIDILVILLTYWKYNKNYNGK